MVKSLQTAAQDKDLQAIATLNQWDVPFLSSPLATAAEQSLDLSELLVTLIRSASPRLRLGITAFFLVHPEKAPVIYESLPLLKENSRQLLKYYYMAAVYLQHLWKSQWARFGEASRLPDYFSQELGLPSPSLLHGQAGLLSLEEALQQSAEQPYNYQASFDSLVQLLLQRRDPHETNRQS